MLKEKEERILMRKLCRSCRNWNIVERKDWDKKKNFYCTNCKNKLSEDLK
jgi:hypothetical protein